MITEPDKEIMRKARILAIQAQLRILTDESVKQPTISATLLAIILTAAESNFNCGFIAGWTAGQEAINKD